MRYSVLVVLLLALGSVNAWAHGGQYKAPPDAGGPGGSSGGSNAPPTNPSGSNGGMGPHAPGMGGPAGGKDGNGGGRGPKGVLSQIMEAGEAASSWESWWDNNKDQYLDLRNRLSAGPATRLNQGHITGRGYHPGTDATSRPDPSRVAHDVLPLLAGLCRDGGDRDILDSAVLAMARACPPDAADTVLAAALALLAHDDLSVQTSATLSLGVLGSHQAAEPLSALMTDSSVGRALAGGHGAVPSLVRAFAALSLGLLDDPASVPALCELIETTGDNERDLKACAIVGLGLMHNERAPDATRFLVERLADRRLDAMLKSYVATSIGKLCSQPGQADPAVLPVLLESFLARDTDAMVRQSEAIALGLLGEIGAGPPSASPVVQALMDYVAAGKDAVTRQFCLIALAQIGGRDESPAAHAETHEALQRLLAREITKPSASQNRPWAALAAALYGRAQPDVRADFALLVGQAYEAEKNPSVRGACVLALGLLEVRSMSETIFADFQRSTEPSFKGYAALALGFLGATDAAPALHADCRAKSITPSYRMKVATALGLLGDREAVGILSETLESAQTLGVSAAVAKALGLIGDEAALEPLMQLATDEEKTSLTRAFACVALGMVCEKTNLPWNARIMANSNYNVAVPAISEVCDIL